MLTNIIVFLVGAHLGAKYPQHATLIVDKAVTFAKSLVAKLKDLLEKK
jgi:hypothetical protein